MGALFRNRSLRRETAAYLALTALLALAGLLLSSRAALLALAAGLLFTCLHVLLAAGRFRRMADLSLEIDRILHGSRERLIGRQEEGELSILENEIQKMTDRLLEQSAQLQGEKEKLVQAIEDIFHQVRTPLTALNIQVSLLAEEDLPPEQRLQMGREAEKQLQRLEWLIESLLKMSRLDAGAVELRRETVSVRTLAEKASAALAAPMELRQQTLQLHIGEETFQGDLSWSAEALGNLLKNCMEHTPAGGTVTVTAEETALYTEIAVQDTGPGFAPEDLPRLFERFYRGAGARAESAGIGLALARRIAAEQNGTLTADNAPEGGARFVLRFHKGVI